MFVTKRAELVSHGSIRSSNPRGHSTNPFVFAFRKYLSQRLK